MSRYYVGEDDPLDLDDPVLEGQLALLEPLDQRDVGQPRCRQGMNCGVEIGVFLAFGGQFKPEPCFDFLQWQHNYFAPQDTVSERDPLPYDRPGTLSHCFLVRSNLENLHLFPHALQLLSATDLPLDKGRKECDDTVVQ